MNDIVTAYLKTWNATDPIERKALLDDHWASEASYTDPMADVTGHDAISEVIGAVHAQFPGFVFSLVSGPDSHHNQARFQWGLGPAGEQPPIIGFDVLATDADGRIRTVHGFLDRVPG
ncbi:isomerase [Mycolicibacterium sp. TY66]|uniref:nuclear transport factor 2 family protein n=1 Tax=unclassified Mycolicibacterium TaxID=2636767 RepID=UPI001BB4238F|nr:MULTISPECIES: nuclear transport factor 2 family protein [unclassified Mycolicibacterium]BCI82918.1 isomerase [Mycolicibacterium sp. TY66]BCJ79432.1 isomerase [Mycolicibacterium sp. TY81]